MTHLLPALGHLFGLSPEQVRDCTPEEIDAYVSYYNSVMKDG